MAQEYNGIVAGISVYKENEIHPKFDAQIYDFIIGQNGHNLNFTFSHTGSELTITVDGFAIADGVRAFFNNVEVKGSNRGYVYVEFSMSHDRNIADFAEIYWSDSELEETHDLIGSQAGTYQMKVLEVTPSDTAFANGKIVNSISCPYKANTADEALVVTERLEDGVTAITQDNSDRSTKVATTEFVQKIYDKIMGTQPLSNIAWQNIASPISTVSIEKKANYVQGQIQLRSTGLLDTRTTKIGTLPIEYAPKQEIETAAGISGTNSVLYLRIATNGDISLGFTGSTTDTINVDANIGYETT